MSCGSPSASATSVALTSDGQPRAVGALELERDLADAALHAQQRRVVRLVVDAAAGVSRSRKRVLPDERVAVEPRHRLEGAVDPDDRPVGPVDEVAAGRVLEELLRALGEQVLVGAHPAR